jgi:hypothetical protein
MPPKPKPKNPGKRCPACGRRVRTGFDGTVRVHYVDQGTYDPETREICSGSNEEPVQELRRERITRR